MFWINFCLKNKISLETDNGMRIVYTHKLKIQFEITWMLPGLTDTWRLEGTVTETWYEQQKWGQ